MLKHRNSYLFVLFFLTRLSFPNTNITMKIVSFTKLVLLQILFYLQIIFLIYKYLVSYFRSQVKTTLIICILGNDLTCKYRGNIVRLVVYYFSTEDRRPNILSPCHVYCHVILSTIHYSLTVLFSSTAVSITLMLNAFCSLSPIISDLVSCFTFFRKQQKQFVFVIAIIRGQTGGMVSARYWYS